MKLFTLLEVKSKVDADQTYKICKYAASGCRIIADGKVIYPGPTGDHGTLTKAAWAKDGPKLEKLLKTTAFKKIEFKERRGSSWVTAGQAIEL